MGPSQGDRALLGGSEYGLVEILQNGACQQNIKNLFDTWCSQLYKDSSQLCYDPALYSLLEKLWITWIVVQNWKPLNAPLRSSGAAVSTREKIAESNPANVHNGRMFTK